MFGGGFGGFPFGGHGHHQEEESYEKDTKLYEIMELDPSANANEIRRQYKKLAVRLHPDKGGDPEKFKELQMAYTVLSDEEKKGVYDKYGMKGIKEMDQGGHPGGGMDIFEHFFGGGGRGRGAGKQNRKCKPQVKEVVVKLEDVYSGKSLKVSVTRKRVCEGCNGQGGANQKVCAPCKGRGVVEKMMMLGPGMYQHVQQPCKDCGGEGKKVDPADICKECKGKKIFDRKKELEVYVEPGTPDEHVMAFYGEGDEMPGVQAGDVQVVIRIQPHKLYQRKGADICMTKNISLVEALCGFTAELVYLDGKKFAIHSQEGEVISNADTRQVHGKGLPFFKDAMGHGNLYIQFNVIFPKKGELTKPQLETLKQILPGGNKQQKITATEVIPLTQFSQADLNENEEGGKKRQEEEDEGNGQQRVQCQQQ